MSAAQPSILRQLARAGFAELTPALAQITKLVAYSRLDVSAQIQHFVGAADPDAALVYALRYAETGALDAAALSERGWRNFALLFGASAALADFWLRHPQNVRDFLEGGGCLRSGAEYYALMREAVVEMSTAAIPIIDPLAPPEATGNLQIKVLAGESGWLQLRIKYRRLLSEIVLADLHESLVSGPQRQIAAVTEALSELAGATIAAALMVARATLACGGGAGIPVLREHAQKAPLTVIAMGKCGARELNVVSDVDVLFVTDPELAPELASETVVRVATRLASELLRVVQAPSIEPPLWEVDVSLRPEGKQGALVRTLGSYLNYYDKWAQAWEFQALLKARFIAGDAATGQKFIAQTQPYVWRSREHKDFVGSVQRMRERVTEHIDPQDIENQLKLGPGGLRDIEFSVQLLQLVHGAHDERLRCAATLGGLVALRDGGYIARTDAEELAAAYQFLRVLEHRLQAKQLRRTALIPDDPEELRVLARAVGLQNSEQLLASWQQTKRLVRKLHLKVFYAPLLSAVAQLPLAELALTTDAAAARLKSIGFKDPAAALGHLAALTAGTSRRAQIQKHLLPVLVQWLGEGTDPDSGLLAFRRISEANAGTPWYLRLLRDGAEAAERLMKVLAGSRYLVDLLEKTPESVAWLENNEKLCARSCDDLTAEMRLVTSRKTGIAAVGASLRSLNRREILRLGLGRITGVLDEVAVAAGLDATYTALLRVLLEQVSAHTTGASELEIAIIAMGRYGGGELGFASDLDVIVVYRAPEGHAGGLDTALQVINLLAEQTRDPLCGLELDFDLRPDGKNGPLVRNLAGYQKYYESRSLTWEAQALLRAKYVAGSAQLGQDFMRLADAVRYPNNFTADQLREVRLLKARMENERIPRGVQPRRHLKLGPGGVSDTEWFVQLLQLQHAHQYERLRTTSTVQALTEAAALGLCARADATTLIKSWQLASELRSAQMLWAGRNSDTLPQDRHDLEGVGRILDYKPGTTTALEEAWFALSRKSRRIFEREFYGISADDGRVDTS
ncbi:bifunctional [glutamine synthetase] adenylyltransferase/[glutamine synthetase]-adenylyl-L-tyrosine phosphorylase [Canibacter sp. lx-45]|uniref:bifunctional [glutamine synthetase] adenylyltransferase/[glutamine synthetase]-adenylyl-L-tyrosine phosphorylase n=1 Tax=Canibacter zhuwentaonis TaxID=2837491 RepID=UPI001BDC60FC|nr:bifunctional [glutamine synthetase] adenylyltransferase/[glutamine synthetase]-adenylyl-L-tyrosine phosphorylase [Canibacter zhuwentaonis]MBT1035156.1 bifunctional [glutamine synthetase] adenylyltransferase/[glutamine synthetase]-adenylyl-L-tyrosine phosphorylase [Canibacter zhuwentaonis]